MCWSASHIPRASGDFAFVASRFPRDVTRLILYAVAAAVVSTIFVVRPGMDGYYRALFPDLVYGRAYKPYVCRVLLPASIRFISSATPEQVKNDITSEFENKRFVRLLRWNAEYLFEYLVAFAIIWLCFLGTLYSWRWLIRQCYCYREHVSDFAPIVGLLCLPPVFFKYGNYVYDPAVLFLFSGGIATIYKRADFWFYAAFLLATLNKETSILLVPLFLAFNRRERSPQILVIHALVLGLSWIVVRGLVSWVFRDNPGGIAEFHLLDHNLRLPLLHPVSTIYLMSVVAFVWWLIGRDWQNKPLSLRTGLFLTLGPLLLLSTCFGYLDEPRVYYEALPFVFLLSLPTIAQLFGISEDGLRNPAQ